MRWNKLRVLAAALGPLSLVSAIFAGEFPVATYTDRGQMSDAAAFNPVSEEFLVTWTSDGSHGSDDWDFSVQGRRFDTAGAPVGDQFQINALTTARQDSPDVAVDPVSGNFVVVWTHRQPAQESYGDTRWRIFGADGAPLTADVQANPGSQDSARPSAAYLPSGDFVISWSDLDASEENVDVVMQRYAGDGTPLGSAFQVSQDSVLVFGGSPMAVDPSNGQFLVVWADIREPPIPEWQIWARAFTSAGVPLGDPFVVAGQTTGDFRSPDVAFEPQSGTFVVVWTDLSELDGDEWGIMMRRVLADGTLLGEVAVVNTTTAGEQAGQRVTTQPTGGEFEIVWQSETVPGSNFRRENIRARRFTAEGVPLGPDLQVSGVHRLLSGSSVAVALPSQEAVGPDPQPFYVWAAWRPCGDLSEFGVVGFYAPAPPDPCALGVDGFELGDFSGWSAAVGQ